MKCYITLKIQPYKQKEIECLIPLGISIEHTGTVIELFVRLSMISLNSARIGGLKLKKKVFLLLLSIVYNI